MSGCSMMGIGFRVKEDMKIPETTAFGKVEKPDETKKKEVKATNVCEECRKADGQHEKWCSMDSNFK